MDTEALANTLVNVAQTLMSSKQQQGYGNAPMLGNNWGPTGQQVLGGCRVQGVGYGDEGYMDDDYNRYTDRINVGPEKASKNYRPRIKPEVGPPNYGFKDYEDLPKEALDCKICRKKMWNDVSFCKHLRGKAHEEMIDKMVEADEDLTADFRRQVAQYEDELHKNKTGRCSMCNAHVGGPVDEHRGSEHHRALKRFLHPHCNLCEVDFEERKEWYYHAYTIEHLTNGLNNKRTGVTERKNLARQLRELERRSDKVMSHRPEKRRRDDDDSRDGDEEREDSIKKKKDEIVVSTDLPEKYAKYVKAVEGYFCGLCKKFINIFDDAVGALEFHCNSFTHKNKNNACREAALNEDTEDDKKAAREEDAADDKGKSGSELYDPEDAGEDDDEDDL